MKLINAIQREQEQFEERLRVAIKADNGQSSIEAIVAMIAEQIVFVEWSPSLLTEHTGDLAAITASTARSYAALIRIRCCLNALQMFVDEGTNMFSGALALAMTVAESQGMKDEVIEFASKAVASTREDDINVN